MFDDRGKPLQEARPATPVEIVGWKELPNAGDEVLEVETEVLLFLFFLILTATELKVSSVFRGERMK